MNKLLSAMDQIEQGDDSRDCLFQNSSHDQVKLGVAELSYKCQEERSNAKSRRERKLGRENSKANGLAMEVALLKEEQSRQCC